MPQNKKQVLIIDDEEIMCKVVREVLAMFDIPVLTAVNGLEGIQLFKQHQENIAFVILDAQMPVMNGKETLPWLRFINPSVPIILSSGFVGEEFQDNKLQMDGYLPKPYSINDILFQINTMSPA